MSEQRKISTVLIANIALVIGVIFWSGFSYSNLEENKVDVKDLKQDLKTLTDKYYNDIMYIRENMLTQEDLREIRSIISNDK